jgi:hypothetical protein
MDRATQVLLRKVAGSKRVSALRRLKAVDELAAESCLWFTSPTEVLYTVSSNRSVKLIRSYLNQLLTGKAEAHRAIVVDRLRHIAGETIAGLYRAIGDPMSKPEVEAVPSVADELVRKYLGG